MSEPPKAARGPGAGAKEPGKALRLLSASALSSPRTCAEAILRRPGRFALRVLAAFKRNQGMLLSGAVAYYLMLSIIPLMLLLLVGLSKIVPEEQLLETVRSDLALIVPAAADRVAVQLEEFLLNRHLIGWVGFLVLIFFATTAFTVLENAMSVIFFHRVAVHRRHFLVSALIPFLFIALMGMGLLIITLISGAIQTLDDEPIRLFGREWGLEGASATVLYLLGVGGLVLLMTGIYLVMPLGRIALRHALVGGMVAAVLWEISRHVLVWYFKTLSLVNLIYGSFAGAVVVLLGFEVAALILLLGAQVIAEFERCTLPGGNEPGSGFNT
jgi:YihY family inner membrane protein